MTAAILPDQEVVYPGSDGQPVKRVEQVVAQAQECVERLAAQFRAMEVNPDASH